MEVKTPPAAEERPNGERGSAGTSRPVKSSMRSDSASRVKSAASARFDDNVEVIPHKSPDTDEDDDGNEAATEQEMLERMRDMQKELDVEKEDDAQVDTGADSATSEVSDLDFFDDSEVPSESEYDAEFERADELRILERYTHAGTGVVSTMTTKAQRAERKRNTELIREIERADNEVRERQRAVHDANDTLARLRAECAALRDDANRIANELREVSTDGNAAVRDQRMRRLQGALEKCMEQGRLRDAEVKLAEGAVRRADIELSRAELARMHLAGLGDEARAVLEQHEHEGIVLARVRAAKEAEFDRSQARRRRRHEARVAAAWREQEERIVRALDAARDGHRKATERLEVTLAQRKDRDAAAAERARSEYDKRMGAILGLKGNMDQIREAIAARHERRTKAASAAAEKEAQERAEILQQGGNPDVVFRQRLARQLKEKERREHERRQSERQLEIVQRLVAEETLRKRREDRDERVQEELDAVFDEEARKRRRAARARRWKNADKRTDSPTSEDGSLSYTSRDLDRSVTLGSASATILRRPSGIDRDESPTKLASPTLGQISSTTNYAPGAPAGESGGAASDKDESTASSEDEMLAIPEFQGMWSEAMGGRGARKAAAAAGQSSGTGAQGASGEGGAATGHQLSKMEKEMMCEALGKLRASVVRKQVVAGKEFKGTAFSAKPDRVVFKDFEVGKVYRRKVTFTNISYSVNTFRPLEIPANLSEFVSLEHTPPGHLSAGLTCDVTVVFKPLVNEDLTGELHFLAETGPFTLPIECVTRKCHARLSATAIDFGDVCLGESVVRSVKILGEGALPTSYRIVRLDADGQRIETEGPVAELQAQPPTGTSRSATPALATAQPHAHHANVHQSPVMPSAGASPAMSHGALVDSQTSAMETRRSSADNLLSQPAATGLPEFGYGIVVRKGETGEVGAYSHVTIDFAFAPSAVGTMEASFEVVFGDASVEPQRLYLRGRGTDVPIFVGRDTVDLRVCMFDRMYRDVLQIFNRGSVAQRIRLNVPRELKGFLEITPKKTALVQAHSSLTAQLRFVPGPALFKACREHMDPVSGQLDVPLEIRVHGQVLPVPYRLRAMVTPSDIEFNVASIDFGPATVHESVRVPFIITNRSALPQQFGFVGLPKHAEVQPNDGFGTLLPYEHIHLDAIFSPMSAGEFSFPLRLRSAIGREFLLPCTGVGIHPPVRLSSSVIELLPTAIGDEMSESIYATNTDRTPQAFEFQVPDGAPIKVSPVVGILQPGQRTRISVTFAPRLDFGEEDEPDAPAEQDAGDNDDHQSVAGDDAAAGDDGKSGRKPAGKAAANPNAVGPTASSSSTGMPKKNPALQRIVGGGGGGGGGAAGGGGGGSRPSSRADGRPTLSRAGSTRSSHVNLARAAGGVKGSTMAGMQDGSSLAAIPSQLDAEVLERQLALRLQKQRAHTGIDGWFRLSCFVRAARPGVHAADSDGLPLADEPCDVRKTVYLDVHARSIPPPLVILSNGGQGSLEFGRVPLGQPAQLSIVIQNVSEEKQHLRSSVLSTKGPFDILNALRCLEPGEKHDLYISFVPQEEAEFFEVLEIRSHSCRLPVRLSGVGVQPTVTIEPKNGLIDLGDVLVGETAHKTFTVRNTSAFEVSYRIVLDGTTSARERANMGLSIQVPEPLAGVDDVDIDYDTGLPIVRRASIAPTANANNMNPFDIVPSEATLAAGESREVVVTFSPDHQSKFYRDTARVQVSSQQEQHVIHLQGRAWSRTMYVIGEDDVAGNGDELFSLPADVDRGHGDARVLLLVFKCNPMVQEGPVKRELEIGNLRGAAKKGPSGEYAFEALSSDATAEGFSIEQLKGQIESGARRTVTIQFAPPRDKLFGRWVETTVPLTLKGDVSEQFLVVLRGYVII